MEELQRKMNEIEERRMAGEITRQEAAQMMSGLTRGSAAQRLSQEAAQQMSDNMSDVLGGEQNAYEYDTKPEYGVKTYGPETDREYFGDRDDLEDKVTPEEESAVDFEKRQSDYLSGFRERDGSRNPYDSTYDTIGPESESEYSEARRQLDQEEELDRAGAEEESSRESEKERRWKILQGE